MTKKALVVKPGGETEVVDFAENSLKVLQTAVGGWVQAIDLNPRVTMWVNEEGKMNGLPYNIYGTKLWELRYGQGSDVIVGDIVFTGGTDHEGETRGLTESQVETLTKFVIG